MLFGLPFFLAGMYVLLGALDIISIKIDQNQPRILFAGFGAVFASVGATLMFGRAGLTIDRRTMKLVKWWGLGVPMKKKEYNLGLFDRITIGRERRKSGNSSRTAYPVKLEGYEGIEKIEYEAPSDYQQARQVGEELAAFLNMDLEDSSSGKKIVRESDKLDESLRDRLKRRGELPETMSMPAEMKSQISEEGHSVCIEIPSAGFKRIHLLSLVPGFIFAACVYLFFFRDFMQLPAPGIVRFIFGGVIVVFFIGAPIVVSLGHALRLTSKRYIVTVTPALLAVEQKRALRSRKIEIPIDELEELELVKIESTMDASVIEKRQGRPLTSQEQLRMQRMLDSNSFLGKLIKLLIRSGIVARSDRQTVKFGEGLSSEELKYLHSLIIKAIQD